MPQISLKSNVPVVRKGFEKLRGAFPKIGRLRLYQAALALKKRMQKPGKKIKYPVKWDTLKQKKAFFASNGFGGGIPTIRKGRYIKGWKVQRLGDSGYTVSNRTKGARYIGGRADGSGESKIHKDRWPLFRSQAEIVLKNLPKLVRENLMQFVKKEVSK